MPYISVKTHEKHFSDLVHEKEKREGKSKHHASKHLKEVPVITKKIDWKFPVKCLVSLQLYQIYFSFAKKNLTHDSRGEIVPHREVEDFVHLKLSSSDFVQCHPTIDVPNEICGFSPGNKDSFSSSKPKRAVALKVV